MREIAADPEHAFAVAPASRSLGVARGEIQESTDFAQSRRRPNTALGCAGQPRRHQLRRIDVNSDDYAMIVAAVAEMAAERHVDASVEKRQCAALVLGSRIEPNTALGKPGTNINREAGQHAAIGEPQPVDEMPRSPR